MGWNTPFSPAKCTLDVLFHIFVHRGCSRPDKINDSTKKHPDGMLVSSKGWILEKPRKASCLENQFTMPLLSLKRNAVQAWKACSCVWKICWKGIWGGSQRLELKVRVWEPRNSTHRRASSWTWSSSISRVWGLSMVWKTSGQNASPQTAWVLHSKCKSLALKFTIARVGGLKLHLHGLEA